MVTLQTVEVPGFREAVRKEQASRLLAFLQPYEVVCGVRVAPVSLRLVMALEVARNGFVVPCTFESRAEADAHAMQVLYFACNGFDPYKAGTVWGRLWDGVRQYRFIQRVRRLNPRPLAVAEGVRDWMAEAFMDAPKGSDQPGARPTYAAYPAYIMDAFAEAGVPFTYAEVMDMPIRRLWQHYRVALKRQNPKYGLTNPSDELFTAAIANKAQ